PAADVEPAQPCKLLLDRQYRCGIVEPLDHAQRDAGEHDCEHAVDVHDDSTDEQADDLALAAPCRNAKQDHQYTKNDLRDLAPEQGSQAAASLVRARIAEELQIQRVLLFEAPIEGLPCGFHVIEFHRRIHVGSAFE